MLESAAGAVQTDAAANDALLLHTPAEESAEKLLKTYECELAKSCGGACSLKGHLVVTNKSVTQTLTQMHCILKIKDERLTVPLDDVTSVTVSKAPFRWR